MTIEQAATLLGVSARHTRRILTAYRRDGAAVITHRIGTIAEAAKNVWKAEPMHGADKSSLNRSVRSSCSS